MVDMLYGWDGTGQDKSRNPCQSWVSWCLMGRRETTKKWTYRPFPLGSCYHPFDLLITVGDLFANVALQIIQLIDRFLCKSPDVFSCLDSRLRRKQQCG